MARKWFDIIKAAEDDSAEIKIYGEIGGPSWWAETIDAKSFTDELEALDVSSITLRINSPGGEVFDGHAIFSAIKRHKATVTTHIDGLAASIASEVALAGDRVVIAPQAMIMIHSPWTFEVGDAAQMRKTADMLDKVCDSIAGVYVRKTGMELADVLEAMDAETWYTADEALEAGLVDEIEDYVSDDVLVEARWDLRAVAAYRHAPTDRIAALVRAEKPSTATVTLALTPELAQRLEQIETMIADLETGARDTDGKVDTEAVAQALRARFEEVTHV